MSVPPLDYSFPPPQLHMPPPGLAQTIKAGPSSIYSHPPPFPQSVPPVSKAGYSASVTFPPTNLPPPTFISSIDVHVPPYPPPTVSPNYLYNKNTCDSVILKESIDCTLKTCSVENPTIKTNQLKGSEDNIKSYMSNVNCSPSFNSKVKSKSQKLNDHHRESSSLTSSSKYSSYRDKFYKQDHKYEIEKSCDRDRVYDKERSRDRERRERHALRERRSSKSPSSSRSRYSRSPSRYSQKESDRDKYYREKYFRDRYEYERRKHESEHRHSSGHRDYRSHSRSQDTYERRRYNRSPERGSHYSSSRDCARKSHAKEISLDPPTRKPMSDREKILVEYSKNYCRTPEDYIEKMRQWTEKEKSEDETSKIWYRSSPAELYYKPIGGDKVEQTSKMAKLCDLFFKKLIERGRKARPEMDELPPLKPSKTKMCKHRTDEESSSSSSESDECLDEDGLQGYSDRIMLELQRKQSHPRRLHPEMWFNNSGEMNGRPLCRCSARARRQGMRHGVYAGEEKFPKCIPTQNNLDRLYHYQITVSPPTNFLIKAPTMINHDEHEFLFTGFSMFSHYKLANLPTCKVIRFNIEYTILYIEESAPKNFTIQELDLFEEYLFNELLELLDLDLGKATEDSCSQFHFMPRFVRSLSEGGCEVLSMCEVLKYLVDECGLLIPPNMLKEIHSMEHYSWQKFVDRIKGMVVTYPGKKPCSVRVDQLDRSAPATGKDAKDHKDSKDSKYFYPEIVHFGVRPPQLSYAGNPEYQKAWRFYVKYRHLFANMAKPSFKERQKLLAKEAQLQRMRTQSKMRRDVTVAISSEGFHTTGLMCDVVQHAMLIPVLVRHLRFHKSLDSLEKKIGYVFKQRALLQTALTHPSYRENYGTNPDHARNSLTNCGIRQPQYGDRRIHYTRKKGIVTLINIMSRPGRMSETESEIKHNERLEFLGDAVVEFLSSIHLFRMFPGLAEGGLATYRASIVQNQHLALLAKNIGLEQFMLYAHGSDLCPDVVMRHAMANCFEALMGALFLDAGLEVTDRVFSLTLWHNEPELYDVWTKERAHPLQEQEPLGDRKYIKDFEFLQKLTEFEDSIGIQFKHIRLLARAFTDRSVGFTHLTLGSNQRLEFLGDTVLQLVVSDKLYRHFPDHHEGHLSLLRSSLVNNRTQSMVCDDLNMSAYAIYNNPKAKPTTKKHKADLLEAFLGALFIDKNLEYCQVFCNACLFPRLQEFIMNQDWNDPKSKLQQCCLTLRSIEGGEPDIPLYKVIECLGPTNTRVYTVGVYFRGTRLAAARGHSIQEAEMNAAEQALACSNELFPQLDHQKRVVAKSLWKKKSRYPSGRNHEIAASLKLKTLEDKVPKAYRLDKQSDSSDESIAPVVSDDDIQSLTDSRSDEDSGLDSDNESIPQEQLENVEVSSLVSDMQKIKDDLIRRNEYEKLKEKCRRSDSDDE